jgi:hypothetical protein
VRDHTNIAWVINELIRLGFLAMAFHALVIILVPEARG